MAKDYSEDQLIQRSAAELLEKELGWTSVYAFDKEVLGDCKSPQAGTLGRTSYHEVLLTERFRKALKTLNPWLTDTQLQECVERMTEHMSSQTLMQINEQKHLVHQGRRARDSRKTERRDGRGARQGHRLRFA